MSDTNTRAIVGRLLTGMRSRAVDVEALLPTPMPDEARGYMRTYLLFLELSQARLLFLVETLP